MPYKYIGKSSTFKGKTLWEILGNLKNFGVGRVVVRQRHIVKYPEPSFMRILKVEPETAPEVETMDTVRRCKVYTESVFRGKLLPSPTIILEHSDRPDYILVHKDEEAKYCTYDPKVLDESVIFPTTMEFPPLLREYLIKESKSPDSDPQLPIAYNLSTFDMHRVAKEGEEPTFKFKMGLGDAIHKSPMYKDIVLK